ncbi:MAG: tetratricopeptide repeat protein [bacterium]|nr:tetratricopeptide repeat protein [bacterium]
MLTALVLLALVAGIVYASRRWPDVEALIFGVDNVDVPQAETAEPEGSPVERTTEAVREHARQAGQVADRTVHKVTEIAGGLLRKKPITAEPEVQESKSKSKDKSEERPARPAADTAESAAEADRPEPVTKEESAAEPEPGPAPQTDPEPRREAPQVRSITRAPGERVTSMPARPSQPAYHDGTRSTPDNFEQLSAEADQAWRDREYERCEEACLKILVQQPKNIKYMTRIGQVYQQLGQLDDAKEAFEAAKKLDPRNFFVLNRLAEVERMLTDKKGRTQFNKVLKK